MSAGEAPLHRYPTQPRDQAPLTPDASPSWLRPLVDNVGRIPAAYRRRLPADVLALVTAAGAKARITGTRRDAA
ncbi:MAG TPA: CoA pyrophosphatase, partial [Mycobacterium sp.]|nr:CoA pyrophosphatase [Mycobacterium sp.]